MHRFELDVDLTDELGNTALNLSAQLGLIDMVHRLISKGANQHKKNFAGQSASDYAFGMFEDEKSQRGNASLDEIVAGAELSDEEGGNESEFEIEDL